MAAESRYFGHGALRVAAEPRRAEQVALAEIDAVVQELDELLLLLDLLDDQVNAGAVEQTLGAVKLERGVGVAQAAPRRSLWRKATFETIRRAFLKIAVRIEELKARVKIALPSAYPYQKALVAMAGCIAAQGP